ncbi:hypothetical protein MCHIJ_13260 [Mycolicibacterium chitae]|uniref:Regulator of polyketide synthase expression n=2 Tax=Mycolicibacterium chitae TaxID=1792 RepID=A0A3S4RRQ5_MYCCI|nr:PucR family transcriptional regulator ligand-binding domain-containing protein [Mycolicibacterium chitae]MCV7104686.1 PucR family transcriptional regulator ligand-binding domain-containing protein [Mycolicibacterium chitae]BBZ01889.1 hypothetical protein MCHIJ_13260 [Mycolicibacterium chitae]VEG50716.1 regulator of polyketide synthase expression [Mycolicibacterium chitae]
MARESPLTVAMALTVPPLDQGTVIAGQRGLQREVRWVDIMHAPAEAFVRAGDLVLTTGADTRQPGVREFLTYVVATSEAAGLVLSPPPEIPTGELLSSLVPLADDRDFPVVSLPWEIAFAAVQKSLLPQINPVDARVQMVVGRSAGDDDGWNDMADAFAEAMDGTEDADGPRQFAEVLRQHPQSMAAVLRTLQPLVDYDRTRRGQLVHTLEILLNEAANISAAARALYLNRHSLLYRIKLIEELTGLSLKDPADRFQLEVSVRVHRIDVSNG